MLRRNLRLKTLLLVGTAVLVIAAGTLVGAVRLLDRAVPGYRADVADWASQRLDQPLEIGAMELAWTWTGPLLKFSDVALLERGNGDTVLHLRELGLHFGFWDLLRGVRQPDGLALAGVEVTLHRGEDGRWRLLGMGKSGDADPMTPADIGRWLDRVGWIRVSDSRLRITDAAHPDLEIAVGAIAGTLRNNGPRHHARIDAELPPRLGGHMVLDAFVLGDLARIDELQAHAYLQVEEIAGARLLNAAGLGGGDLSGGTSKLELWSDWRQGRFDGARASLHLGALRLLAGGDGEPTALQPAATVDLSLKPRADAYRLELDALRTAAGTLPATGGVTLRADGVHAEGSLHRLPADLIADWLKLAAPRRLAQAAADGTIDELTLRYANRDDWRLAGRFTGLALRDPATGLDAGRFDGGWDVGADRGELRLAAGHGEIALDRYLQGRLPLASAAGRVTWENTTGGWRIGLHDLQAAAAGTAAAGGGELRLPNTGPPVADLTFEVTSDDLPAVLAHIPQAEDLPNPRLRQWLPEAIRAGRITTGRVRLAGPLDRFPMAGDAGEFRITAQGEGVTLAYKPGWPELVDVTGNLTLAGDDLDIRARSGRMLGVAVGPARARVADVREPVLKVDGQVRDGGAQRMLGFFAQSPLADKFGRLPEVLSLDGKADLDLSLSIPLKPELGDLIVNGVAHVDGLRAEHAALPEPLTGITGDLRFDLKGLYAEDVAARFAGLPLTASVAPAAEDTLAIRVETTAQLPEHAPALAAFETPDWLIRSMNGESRWRIELAVGTGARASDVTLTSDLAGLDLDLPAPLGKSAEAAAPTRLTVTADRDHLHLDYGDRLDLDLRFDADGLWGATAVFGGAEVIPPAGPGWWLGGHLAQLDAGAWHRLLAGAEAGGGDGGGAPALRGANLRIGQLDVAGQRLSELDLRIAPLLGEAGWRAELAGAGAQGTIRWLRQPDRDRIEARLERLRLTPRPETRATDGGGEPTDPATLPLLDATVASLSLSGRDFGRMTLLTTAAEDGLALERLELAGGVAKVQASGEWRRSEGLTRAALTGKLRGSGLAALLQTLGYTPNLRAADAKLDTELRIAPNPDGITPDTLNGRLSLELKNGNLLAVEPGAGRVLGLVNFHALPRRLLLDFRDVLGKGTAFDRLSGDFRIESGNAYTDNLAIQTPSAEIRIEGRVGLAARDYDQRVTIIPQVSGAAAIAGTVLGGPAVGAAVWVAQQLLDKPLGELTRVSYHLTGSWDDPRIEEPTANE